MNYKKIISLILSVTLCFSCFAASFSTVNAEYTITSLKTEDFEDSDYTKALWETEIINTAGSSSDNSNATVTEEYEILDDNGNKVLLPNKSDKQKGPAVMMYRDELMPYETITKVSVDFKATNTSTGDGKYDAVSTIVPFYLSKMGDHTEGTVIYMHMQTVDGKLQIKSGNNSKYAVRTGNLSISEISAEGWINLVMEYDYSQWAASILGIKYTFTDSLGNTATTSDTYKLTLADSGYNGDYFRFGIGSYTNSNYIFWFDNVSCEFEKTEKDEALAFYNEHKEVLELESWNDSYTAAINAAADDYAALSDGAVEVVKSWGVVSNLKTLLEGTNALAEYNAFLTKYAELLAKQKPTDSSDEKTVTDALTEYDACSNLSKMFLVEEYAKLKYFQEEFAFFRADDNYSPFSFDFEDGLSPLENVIEGDVYAKNVVVDDPTQNETANKVLNLKGQQSAFMLKYWPSLGEIQKVSFKVYCPRNESFTPWRAMFSYIDEGNYYSFNPVNLASGGMRIATSSSADYLRKSGYLDTELDMSGWVEYEIIFTSSSFIVSAKDQNKKTAQTSSTFSYGGNFGFAFFQSYDHIGNDMYIDDLYVELKNGAGDFDMNEEQTDINVYFSGNTFLSPDETITLEGEQLFETVDEIYMTTLETDLAEVKDETAMPQAVSQVAYDDDGSTAGNYADTASHTFNSSAAYKAEIVQRSFNAINAVIPQKLTAGIYSMCLTSKKGTGDAVIYVNRPEISFATGDEGDITTYGGYVQIVGNNLCPTGDINDITVKLVSADKKIYTIPVTESDNNYSVTISVDESVPYGEYQVYLHNGYGDNTAWSMPSVITVGASPKDSWPKTVFNVMSYGAGGQGLTNDTPAVIRALEDAAKNGGGIVYFPTGVYSVVTNLAIPEYVTVLGDGENKSVIRYEARRWQYGEAPSALLSIIGNTEIKDIAIQGTRLFSAVKTYRPTNARFYNTGETDNIYLTNTSMRFTTLAGYPTSGGNGGWPTQELSAAEIKALIEAELSQGVKLDFRGATNNLQWNSFDFSIDSFTGGSYGDPTFRIWASQVQIRDASWAGYSLASTSYGCIIEDSDLTAAGFNPSGKGFYMYNNYFHDSWGNNRELLTTDGVGYSNNIEIQFIGDNPELMQKYLGTSELDYTAYLSVSTKYTVPMVEQYDVVVKDGQGRGQVRKIREIKNVKVTGDDGKTSTVSILFMDKPFAVNPNRRSRVDVYEPRVDFYFVDNRFREGAASGTYGTMINTVWDGNEFSRHSGQRFDVHMGSIWYMTCINQYHYEAIYMHGEGFGASGSAAAMNNKNNLNAALIPSQGTYAASTMGVTWRNCTFEEYGFSISGGGAGDALSGFVMENCTFTDRTAALRFVNTSTGYITAALFRNNNFDTDYVFDTDYPEYEAVISESNVNRQGYQRVIFINSNYDEAVIILGDVNLDGKVTIKDATVLRFYLADKLVLTQAQKLRADANEDSRISLKDVTTIREMILGIYEKPEDTSSSSSESSGSSSVESGGSGESGSSSSTGGSSSSSDSSVSSSSGPSITDNSGWIGGDF